MLHAVCCLLLTVRLFQTKIPRQTARDFISAEVFRGRSFRDCPELFSRLFYVAASRLNSPRFQLCLYAARKRTVKQRCRGRWLGKRGEAINRTPGIQNVQCPAFSRLVQAGVSEILASRRTPCSGYFSINICYEAGRCESPQRRDCSGQSLSPGLRLGPKYLGVGQAADDTGQSAYDSGDKPPGFGIRRRRPDSRRQSNSPRFAATPTDQRPKGKKWNHSSPPMVLKRLFRG